MNRYPALSRNTSLNGTLARGLALAMVAGLAVVPLFTAIAAAAVLVAQSVLALVCNGHQFRKTAAAPRATRPGAMAASGIKLSVHVPAHKEPAPVLIATLASLRHQPGAPPHEIVVIVNNTSDPALWQPVQAWCAGAGPQFRFLRRDGVTGAKAGALNIALAATDPATSHVVVVDADYQVTPGFLATVASELARTKADFIQFPQAYRHLTPATEGLSFELADYFNRHARAANLAHAMLLTGTLSVISRPALTAVGGWPGESCTEDAALGCGLIAAGYTGVFIDRVVGRGLMPLDLAGLHTQRHRWAAGNARVLVATAWRWTAAGRRAASPLHRSLVVSQLAAWLNLGALACALLVAGLVQTGLGLSPAQGFDAPAATITLSVGTLALILCGAVVPLLRPDDLRTRWPVRFGALLSRVAMLPVSAGATLSGLSTRPQAFRVTPKHVVRSRRDRVNVPLLVAGIAAVLVMALGLWQRDGAAVCAGALLLLPPACARFPRRSLATYAETVAAKER
ncbi:glycosyltransferase family 2 protein [Paracoccaceae bacterium Fryx2]|nr:glycosyltransferase family 2 protein [Paracoccaceae bacterium Fryx2]